MNAESRIDRIMQRYNQNNRNYQDLHQRLQQSNTRKNFENSKPFSKTNFLQDDIKNIHRDAMDVLLRETKYKQREKSRYLELHQNKFQKFWGKIKFPKLTKKY